jgi:hypothetical protein
MKKKTYACKYGATSNRKCLVEFSGNGYDICRLYETGRCNFNKNGNIIHQPLSNIDARKKQNLN